MKEQIVPHPSWRPSKVARNIDICRAYASGRYTTGQVAKRFKLSRRQIIYIAQQGGIVRSQAESNRVVAPLKPKHRLYSRRHGYEADRG